MSASSVEEFQRSVDGGDRPPEGLSPELRALWHARKGNWEVAHEIAQEIETAMGSWIHAHLHLIEGDLGNAGYWYRRAGRPASPPERIDEEWRTIVETVLGEAVA